MNSLRLYVFAAIVFALHLPDTYSQSTIFYQSTGTTAAEQIYPAISDYADSISGNWTYIAPLDTALSGVASIYLPDSDKVLICGGLDSAGGLHTSCYFYDPLGNSYIRKADLPSARAFGKLVRIANAIYLVGAVGPDWHAPDGLIFRYDPNLNTWAIRDTMPQPFVHEPAVCVWKDSLIIVIGGARNGFQQANTIVRVYNPRSDSWTTLPPSSSFPVPVTASQAEIINDTTIITVGGYGSDYINNVYAGRITRDGGDTLSVAWRIVSTSPFGLPVYRTAGANWESPTGANMPLFGPAMRYQYGINQVYGCYYERIDTSTYLFTFLRFYPNSLDSAGNRPTLAVRPRTDSVELYLFGGYKYPNTIPNSERYSFSVFPIGIAGNENRVPQGFDLFQNYPNPFNQFSIISYQLSIGSNVSLSVFDVLGREITVLVNGLQKAGSYSVRFDASGLASGIYFYRLSAGEFRSTRKLILVK